MSNSSLEEKLRKERTEIWSRCALSAKSDLTSAKTVCSDWSHAADKLLTEAFISCFPSTDIALFALGKLGSNELNLSSDVDLLFVCDELTQGHLSSLRKFQKILGEHTSLGFVFRLDFDLRPGGRHGPVIPTTDQFKDYYGNYGETWERLALVRLRDICGDKKIIEDVLGFAKKFSFRKHLDFTLLEDLKGLRSKIQTHYHRPDQESVIDLKLGIGGIRDVELFTHALQVIHGGKDPSLQIHGTTEALELIKTKKLLPIKDADFLIEHYWKLRGLENYVQALNDEQTHLLNLNDTHPAVVCAETTDLQQRMKHCDQIVQSLLGVAVETKDLDQKLQDIGVPESDLQELWAEILDSEVLSRNKGRDEISRRAFLSSFVDSIQEQQGDLRRGLHLLRDFIKGTRAKASFFTLLLREKELMQELAWLFGHSPYLSRILCNRPELLDSFVYRAQDKLSEDLGTLLEELAERRLLSEIINGSSYLEDRNLPVLLQNLSSTADSIVLALLNALKKDYPSDLQILALGKWGGKELGFRSDLDFIFVTPNDPQEGDYKLAKRFISRLTEAHRGGFIYSIDMRLRPSGKAGPLVISATDLVEYLKNEALPWERQAYLKARWVGNSLAGIKECFIQKGLSKEELQELDRIRGELQSADTVLDLKYSEGALIDLELASQAAVLLQKQPPQGENTLSFFASFPSENDVLQTNYNRLRQIEQMLQLVASESITELSANHESFQALALALHLSPNNLLNEVQEILTANIALLKSLDPRRLSL